VQVLPIDYDEITMGTDARTNYELLPFDRLVVPRDPTEAAMVGQAPRAPATTQHTAEREHTFSDPHFPRALGSDPQPSDTIPPAIARRLDELEAKLDAILQRLDQRNDK
jgi:hypothetical protein